MPQRTLQRACTAAVLVALVALATPAQAASPGGPPEISNLLLRAWEWLVDQVMPAPPQLLREKESLESDTDGRETRPNSGSQGDAGHGVDPNGG